MFGFVVRFFFEDGKGAEGRRKTLWFRRSGFALGLAAIFWILHLGCSSVMQAVLSEPKITFGSIGVRDANNEGATVVVGLNVENPNRVGLQIDELNYVLEMGGRQVAASKLEKLTHIEARATTKVEIPIPFRYDQVFGSILDLISKGSAAYKIKGEARVGVFILPFDQSGELNLRK